jgi:hypothetical protein
MSKRNGLALIIALLAALALASAAVILASYCLTAGIESEAAHRRALLRQAAEAAALRGLAELQAGVGPDARFTYPDTAGALHGSGSRESRQLDGEAWLDALKLSWSFRDFSMAYDRAAGAVARGKASDWAKGLGARPRLPQALAAELTQRQQRALLADAPDFFEEVPGAGGSWQTRGLLTDPVRGGWRRDFSVPTELAHALGPALGSALNAEHWKRPPGRGYPLGHVVSEERSLSTVPVLTDLRLSLGFFNSRHDGRHRLRFHGSGVLWNPLTVPVLAGPQGRLFLVEVVGAPEISVTNLEAGSGFVVDLDDGQQRRAEKALVALGRIANVEGLGLEAAGVALTARGHVAVDAEFRTTAPRIFAAGDVIGPPSLASAAMEQGRLAACHALGLLAGEHDPSVPSGVYTLPEIACVGLSERDALARHGRVIVGRARFDEIARGQIAGAAGGLLRIVSDPLGQRLLGAQVVGEQAAELVHVAQLVIATNAPVDMLVDQVFNFPTFAEAWRVAALDVIRQRSDAARARPAATGLSDDAWDDAVAAI